MLYERWLETVRKFGDQPALNDRINQRRWTFKGLSSAVEERSSSPANEVRFPQGRDVSFVLDLLTAWRDGAAVCPLEPGEARPDLSQPLPVGVVHLKQTSGTTAAKRFVLFTGEQLAADAENIVTTMGLSPESPNLGIISLAHSYGFSNLVLPLLLHGIPLTLATSPLPEELRATAATANQWTLPAVPALWQTWHDADAIPRNLRMAISAGAPLPLAVESNVLKTVGVKIHNFIGSSECGGIAFDATDVCRSNAGIAGNPLANVQVSIGDHGCIEVQGPSVASGYWPDAHKTLEDGRFQTQDLAEWREGTLVLLGRAGDVINISGRKVSPEKIENALQSHLSVSECVVFGVPSEATAKNEDIVACIQGEEPDFAELREHARQSLQPWEIPSVFVSVNGIEANARGKISRREWRARFLSGGI